MAEGGKRKKKLGKGLSALFSDRGGSEGGHLSPNLQPPATTAIENLHPGQYQPRQNFGDNEIQELADSIKSLGILQPILVRRTQDGSSDYEIIAGERRWRAAQLAQVHAVPIIIKELSNAEALEIALVENLQRQNLSVLEEADGYQRLIDEFSHTQDELAQIIGKIRSHVANTMRLLQLPEAIKTMLGEAKLSAGHARALLNADDAVGLAKKVVKRGLNVRQTEKLAQAPSATPKAKPAPRQKDADTLALENDLSSHLGLDVKIDDKGNGGTLSVSYKSLEQLDDLLHRLTEGAHGKSVVIDNDEIPLAEDDNLETDSVIEQLVIETPLENGDPFDDPSAEKID